jgi:hypothetical protein
MSNIRAEGRRQGAAPHHPIRAMQVAPPRDYGRKAVTVPESPSAIEPPRVRDRGHVRRALGGTKELVRIAYRDPAHISERLTLHAARNLAEPSRRWAEDALHARPEATPAELADDLRAQSVKIARIDGAIAGTPFFVALVPGYLSYLWQEARMGLRTAALFGHDPGTMRTAAEMLTLRGVHPTVHDAEAALRDVEAAPPPVTERRSLRTWFNSVRYVLIFGGFLAAPTKKVRRGSAREYVRAGAGALLAFAIWLTTWVIPVSFMIALAWGCESHARKLGLRTLALYGGEETTTTQAIAAADRHNDEGRTKRQVLRSIALGLSVAVPIAFVAYANHVRQDTGINWLGGLGALVALSLVGAGTVYGSRR